METGFAVMKRGNLWTLKMQGSETSGTFGSLSACMQCAYHLTDAHFSDDVSEWSPDCNGAPTGSV
jgi:hypothetical protein